MKQGINLLLTILFLSSFSALRAQVLPLDSVLRRVESSNPDLQQYTAMIKAQSAYAEGARSWDPLKVGAGLYMVPYTFEKNMGSVMFTAEQMIPNPVRLKQNQAYMKGMAEVTKEELNLSRTMLRSETRMQYYQMAIVQKKLLVLQESALLLQYLIKASEIRYSYNKEDLSNIYKAKARLGENSTEKSVMQSELEMLRIRLNTLMNRPKDFQFVADTNVLAGNTIFTITDTSSLRTLRSDYRKLEKTIELNKLNQSLERSKRLPDFGVRYDHMNAFGMQPNQFTLMGMMTIPITPWATRGINANIKGMNYEIEASRKMEENLINEVSGRLESIRSQSVLTQQQLSLYNSVIIPAMHKSYDAGLISYQQNTGDLFRVLDSWSELLMARMKSFDIQQKLFELRADYEKELEK